MDLEEVYKQFLSLPKEKLFELGVQTGQKLIEILDSHFGDHKKSFAQFVKIYGSFSGIDWKITPEEHELFLKLTGVSSSFLEFEQAVKDSYDIDSMIAIDKLIDENPYDIKPLVMRLGFVICAYDGVFTNDEKALLEKFLA